MLVLNFTACTVLQVALESKNYIWHKEHRHNIRRMLCRVGLIVHICKAVVPKRWSASIFIYFLHNPQLCRIMKTNNYYVTLKLLYKGDDTYFCWKVVFVMFADYSVLLYYLLEGILLRRRRKQKCNIIHSPHC